MRAADLLAAVFPEQAGCQDNHGGEMVVLPDHPLPEQEIHAVFPSPKLVPGKVSSFVAFLQGHFGEGWWQLRA